MPLETAKMNNPNSKDELHALANKLQMERDESRMENHELRAKLRAECTHHMRTVADRDRLHCEVAELRRALDSQNSNSTRQTTE